MSNARVFVWDLPVRLFHWTLALSFAGAFLTAESERWRDVHVVLGYTVLGLVAFRLLWAFVGSRYARLSSFAFGPRAVAAYLKSLLSFRPQHYVGHNPAGSFVIYGLVLLALVTGAAGYATYNDIGGHWLEEFHEGAANVMLTLVVVHVAGVVVSSLLHRENLVKAMLTGYKRVSRPAQAGD
jgi:cytochrome b